MNRRFRGIEIVLVLLIPVLTACARIASPSGGPRDRKPPVLLGSVPVNRAVNFSDNKIVITFNEYIALDKVSEKFMVSPPMKKKPSILVKGKNLIIEYDDVLRENTSYTFYFQDAVEDLNEGNALEDFRFVFSTGSYIDSLSVTGNVYQALSLDPPGRALVLLYSNLSDSAVRKTLPDYISIPDDNGYFRIDNAREGIYRLHALKEKDNSKTYNLDDEDIAFMEEPISITPGKNFLPVVADTAHRASSLSGSIDTVVKKGEYKLLLFQPAKTKHYLTSSSRDMPFLLRYTLSLPPDSGGFSFSIPGAGKDSFFIERGREGDTIDVWITDSAIYSMQKITTVIRYPQTDTTGGRVIARTDTLSMQFLFPRASRKKPKPEPFKLTSGIFKGSLKPGCKIIFQSRTPFRAPDTSRIRLYVTDGSARNKIPCSFAIDSARSCRLVMNAGLEMGKGYLFIADSAAFGSIYGENSDSTGIRFSLADESTLGSITLDIKNHDGKRIVQLLSAEGKVVAEKAMTGDGKVEFRYLVRGKYRPRVIYDLNGDGKWTTGDFIKGRQPEPVSYFGKEIEVTEGWSYDEDWDISEQNIRERVVKPSTGK
jgi:hypothetical protein